MIFSAESVIVAYFFRHMWDVPVSWFTVTYWKVYQMLVLLALEAISQLLMRPVQKRFVGDLLLGPATFFAKVSLLLLYLRLFGKTNRTFRIKIYITIAFCACLYWVNVPLGAYFCAPKPGQEWDSPEVFALCSRSLPYAIVQGVLNVVVDFWLLWLPLPVIWNLNMALKKRLGVIALFMTGCLYGFPPHQYLE